MKKICRICFLLCGLSAFLVFIFGIRGVFLNIYSGMPSLAFFIFLPIVVFAVSLYFVIKNDLFLYKVAIFNFVVVGALLLAADYVLYYMQVLLPQQQHEMIYKEDSLKNNRIHDNRSKLEFWEDFKKQHKGAVPLLHPSSIDWSIVDNKMQQHADYKGPIRSMGGISNAVTVFCHTLGLWKIYQSDRYGFNNPNEVYENKLVEFATIGDSYTHATCIDADKTFAGRLRAKGVNAINFGIGSTHPVHYLAVTTEYLTHLKPKHVLLFFFEGNDYKTIDDIEPFLHNYLKDENFSQNLINRQEEINSMLGIALDVAYEGKIHEISYKKILKDVLLLRNIRSLLGIKYQQDSSATKNQNVQTKVKAYTDFTENVLIKINNLVKSWNGKLYVVYIPAIGRTSNTEIALPPDAFTAKGISQNKFLKDELPDVEKLRTNFLRILNKNNIAYIDILTTFENYPNPTALYRFEHNHFSELGYSLMYDVIIQYFYPNDLVANKVPILVH